MRGAVGSLRRRTAILLIAVLVVTLSTALVQAATYNYSTVIAFSGVGPGGGTYNFGPPIAGFPGVNSSWNQPRSTNSTNSTNPHQGADVKAGTPTRVDAVCDGFVTYQNDTTTYELFMTCDRNGNKVKDDDLQVKYDHLSKVGFQDDNTWIAKGTQVAESGSEGGAYPPHLHFGALANRGDGKTVWVRNEPYYRWTSYWNTGNDIDFISWVRWNSTDTAVVRAYTMDDRVHEEIRAGLAKIYHRVDNTGTWSVDTPTKSGDDFSFDLGNRYPVGTVVNWMFRIERTDLADLAASDPTKDYYRWAFMIPKYARPNENPNSVAYKYDYYRCTIGQSTCTEVRTTP